MEKIGIGSARKTKRHSASHESLIESIHGDSGEKKSPVSRYEWQTEERESMPGRYNEVARASVRLNAPDPGGSSRGRDAKGARK